MVGHDVGWKGSEQPWGQGWWHDVIIWGEELAWGWRLMGLGGVGCWKWKAGEGRTDLGGCGDRVTSTPKVRAFTRFDLTGTKNLNTFRVTGRPLQEPSPSLFSTMLFLGTVRWPRFQARLAKPQVLYFDLCSKHQGWAAQEPQTSIAYSFDLPSPLWSHRGLMSWTAEQVRSKYILYMYEDTHKTQYNKYMPI